MQETQEWRESEARAVLYAHFQVMTVWQNKTTTTTQS